MTIVAYIGMKTLAEFLNDEVERTSLRDVGDKTGLAHTVISRIIKGKLKGLPELETLDKIARGYNHPLWQVVEMAGADLGLGTIDRQKADQLASLMKAFPDLMPRIVDSLLQSDPEDHAGFLAYLELQRQLRQQRSSHQSGE